MQKEVKGKTEKRSVKIKKRLPEKKTNANNNKVEQNQMGSSIN